MPLLGSLPEAYLRGGGARLPGVRGAPCREGQARAERHWGAGEGARGRATAWRMCFWAALALRIRRCDSALHSKQLEPLMVFRVRPVVPHSWRCLHRGCRLCRVVLKGG